MNEKAHWNGIASRYDDEIFDVFASDRKKRLPYFFKKHGNKEHTALDFGCGTGKAFPYIAPLFKKIVAVDISSECLVTAKERGYNNVSFRRMDLSRTNLAIPEADFVFCCNVIMLPEVAKNEVMIRNIRKCLAKNGTALLVLPSLDSILYSSWRLMDWYRKEGVSPEEIPASELSYFKGTKREIIQGIMHIDGVPTKHYGYSELEVLFERAGLTITRIERLEYDWTSEFAAPPTWMREPYPWDWLVECKNAQ